MPDPKTTNRLTAWLPIVMSLISLALVIQGHIQFGSHPPKDEGWQAHIFQFLMGAQLPIIALFVLNHRWNFKKHIPIFAAQVFLFLLVLGALRYFAL